MENQQKKTEIPKNIFENTQNESYAVTSKQQTSETTNKIPAEPFTDSDEINFHKQNSVE